METLTAPVPPAEAVSAKVSSSEDELLDLKRLQLVKLNRLTGRETPEQVEEAWSRFETDRDQAAQNDAKEHARIKHDAMMSLLRDSVRRYGFAVPEGSDEQALRKLIEAGREKVERQRAQHQQAIHAVRLQERADQLFRSAKFPERAVEDLNLDVDRNAQWTEIRDVLVNQAQYASGYLVGLLGIRGVGKTVLAASVARMCCDRMMTARYVKALDLFRDFRKAYTPVRRGDQGDSEEDIIASWVAPDLLVIDELHQRGETAFENNTLVNLLDLRYDARKCTILIANQSKQEFSGAMGDSVVSRIHQTGDTFECDWPSYRKPGSWKQDEVAAKRSPSGILKQNKIDN